MTTCGMAWTAALVLLALGALGVCSVRPGDGPGRRAVGSRRAAPTPGKPEEGTEPRRFRCGELRLIDCRASGQRHVLGAEDDYTRKELAYVLADQLIEAGAIRYSVSGDQMRAELRAVLD